MSNLGIYRHHHHVAALCHVCKATATGACGRCRAPSCESHHQACGHAPVKTGWGRTVRELLSSRYVYAVLALLLPIAGPVLIVGGLFALSLYVPYRILTHHSAGTNTFLSGCRGCDPSGMEQRARER
jgi:hypothetical protein